MLAILRKNAAYHCKPRQFPESLEGQILCERTLHKAGGKNATSCGIAPMTKHARGLRDKS